MCLWGKSIITQPFSLVYVITKLYLVFIRVLNEEIHGSFFSLPYPSLSIFPSSSLFSPPLACRRFIFLVCVVYECVLCCLSLSAGTRTDSGVFHSCSFSAHCIHCLASKLWDLPISPPLAPQSCRSEWPHIAVMWVLGVIKVLVLARQTQLPSKEPPYAHFYLTKWEFEE